MDPKDFGKRAERVGRELQAAREKVIRLTAEAEQIDAEWKAFLRGETKVQQRVQHQVQQVTA